MNELFSIVPDVVSGLILVGLGALITHFFTTRTNESTFLRQRRFKLWENQVQRIDKLIDLVLEAGQLASQIQKDSLQLQNLEQGQVETGFGVPGEVNLERTRQELQLQLPEKKKKLVLLLEEIDRLAFVVMPEGSPEDMAYLFAVRQVVGKAQNEHFVHAPIDLSDFLRELVVLRDTLPVLKSHHRGLAGRIKRRRDKRLERKRLTEWMRARERPRES